jgi:hypothetical protein
LILRVHIKISAHVSSQFENAWISWYPRPIECIFDQEGGAFIGQPFADVLLRHHIHPHPRAVENPQANGICERLHATVSNALRPLPHAHYPANTDEAAFSIDTAHKPISLIFSHLELRMDFFLHWGQCEMPAYHRHKTQAPASSGYLYP